MRPAVVRGRVRVRVRVAVTVKVKVYACLDEACIVGYG
jgi:hypothetical protein